jgi:DNA modification methylase
MVFTDPPYNVDYGTFKGDKFRQRPIENDNMNSEEYQAFCEKFAEIIGSICDGCFYVCHAPNQDGRILASVFDKLFHCSTTIIWNKDVFTLGRGKYQNKYEPIWFGWNKDGSGFVATDRAITNVWDIPRPKASKEHPTMKPVELVERAIKDASIHESMIYDPFLGSGTTLIACERLGRKCRAVEISPAYVAVAIQRWVDVTGGEPVLLGS